MYVGAEENYRTFQVRIPGEPVHVPTWHLPNTSQVRLQTHVSRVKIWNEAVLTTFKFLA